MATRRRGRTERAGRIGRAVSGTRNHARRRAAYIFGKDQCLTLADQTETAVTLAWDGPLTDQQGMEFHGLSATMKIELLEQRNSGMAFYRQQTRDLLVDLYQAWGRTKEVERWRAE